MIKDRMLNEMFMDTGFICIICGKPNHIEKECQMVHFVPKQY